MLEIRSILVFLSLATFIQCTMEPFIVGGKKAKIKMFPHSVFMFIQCFEGDQPDSFPWICGGSIVNEKIVLTAAHCIYGCSSKSTFTVSVGHRHLQKGVVSSARNYLIHEKYRSGTLSNDIALVKLKTVLKLGKNVKRIALMMAPPYYEKAQIAGWGMTNEDTESMGMTLKYVDQWVWKIESCRQVIRRIQKGTICASSGDRNSYSSRPEVQQVALMKNPPYFEEAQVAGCGFVKEIDSTEGTEDLHYIDQYVSLNGRCKRKIKRLKKGSFCASSRVETPYFSGGDSGSALVVRGYIQIGIVSYKMPNISKSLVVYTDTGFFYEWIKKNSKKLYCVIEQA